MEKQLKPEGDRFVTKFMAHLGRWVVVDLKFQQDNLVRDWRAKGDAGKRRVWKGDEQSANELAEMLNKAYRDDDKLITNVERSQSNYVPWKNSKRKSQGEQTALPISKFKTCGCGAMYKGEKHCG